MPVEEAVCAGQPLHLRPQPWVHCIRVVLDPAKHLLRDGVGDVATLPPGEGRAPGISPEFPEQIPARPDSFLVNPFLFANALNGAVGQVVQAEKACREVAQLVPRMEVLVEQTLAAKPLLLGELLATDQKN